MGETSGLGLLGEMTACVDGRPSEVGPARQRLVLAALAMDAGHGAPSARRPARGGGEERPLRARSVLGSYISRLRAVFGSAAVAWRSGGYVLAVDRMTVDVHRFGSLCREARTTPDDKAASLLAEALALWRGPVLTGLDGEWAVAERDRLQQQRLQAEHDLTEARLRTGHGE